MPTKAMYANDHYTVFADPKQEMTVEGAHFFGTYILVSKDSGVTEFMSPCLPEVLRMAAHWDIALTEEAHLWPYKNKAEQERVASFESGELLQ